MISKYQQQRWQEMNPWSQKLSCTCQVYVYILRVTLKLGLQLSTFCLDTPTHSLDIQIFIKKTPLVTPFAHQFQTSIQKKPSALILEHNKTTANTFKSQIYILYQSFNETTSDSTPWSYITFTFVEYDHGDDNTGYRIGSKSVQSVVLGVNQMQK